MNLFELCGCKEDHEVYRTQSVENLDRQYDFLRSIVASALAINTPYLSQVIMKSLNYHAIACLHGNAGEYRPCAVTVGKYEPPEYFRVQSLMDDFVNQVNSAWSQTDPILLAAFVLWRLNWIHPFINGNGRTARATCYYIICLKAGGWLPGKKILPQLIKENRDEYVLALRAADDAYKAGKIDVEVLRNFLARLLTEQLGS